MDAMVWIGLAALLLIVLVRFRRTRRMTRVEGNREEQIRRKLEELRKKRDEDNGI